MKFEEYVYFTKYSRNNDINLEFIHFIGKAFKMWDSC